MQKFFAFFSETPVQTHKFLHLTHVPPPRFENFPLDTLNSEQKTSVKKTVDRAGQKPVDRPVDRPVNRR